MMCTNLSDVAVLNIKGSHYCCIVSLISKTEGINLFQNVNLTEKVGHYKLKKIKSKFFRAYIKMEKII